MSFVASTSLLIEFATPFMYRSGREVFSEATSACRVESIVALICYS